MAFLVQISSTLLPARLARKKYMTHYIGMYSVEWNFFGDSKNTNVQCKICYLPVSFC